MDLTTHLQIVQPDLQLRTSLIRIAETYHWQSSHFSSAEEFLNRYQPQRIECLLIDLELPAMDGLQLLHEMRRRHWSPPIIVTQTWPTTRAVVGAMQAGACDFIEQPFVAESVHERVMRTIADCCHSREQLYDRTARLTRLSPREREVLDLLLAAESTVAIAHRLDISPKTVEKHRTNLMAKLNVDSVPALMKLWLPCQPDKAFIPLHTIADHISINE